MKKIFALFLALVMVLALTPSVFAETGYESYSTEELHEMLGKIRNELSVRDFNLDEMTLIYDKCDVQIYLTGKVNESFWENTAEFGIVIVNNSDIIVRPSVKYATINGWAVSNMYGVGETPVHAKRQDNFTLPYELANITSINEIEDINMTIQLVNDETYDVIDNSEETINISLNGA